MIDDNAPRAGIRTADWADSQGWGAPPPPEPDKPAGPVHYHGRDALYEGDPDEVITWWWWPQDGVREPSMMGPVTRATMRRAYERMEAGKPPEDYELNPDEIAKVRAAYDGYGRGKDYERRLARARLIKRIMAERFPMNDEARAFRRRREEIIREERQRQAEERRREADETRRLQLAGLAPLPATWWGHLAWLHKTFGDRGFSTGQVCDAGYDDPDMPRPPGFRGDLTGPDGARQLGTLYASVARKPYDGAWIEPGPVTHGVRRWHVTVKADQG